MEPPVHKLPALFKQLGLPDDALSIDQFIASHSPLKPGLHLADAFFWSEGQRQLLPTGRWWWISWMCCCARAAASGRDVGDFHREIPLFVLSINK
jgi:hypothetical protein